MFGAHSNIIYRVRCYNDFHTYFMCRWLWVWTNAILLQVWSFFPISAASELTKFPKLLSHKIQILLPLVTRMSLTVLEHKERWILFSLTASDFETRSQNCGKPPLASSCLSTWNNSAPQDRYSWHLIFEHFAKIWREVSSKFVKNEGWFTKDPKAWLRGFRQGVQMHLEYFCVK